MAATKQIYVLSAKPTEPDLEIEVLHAWEHEPSDDEVATFWGDFTRSYNEMGREEGEGEWEDEEDCSELYYDITFTKTTLSTLKEATHVSRDSRVRPLR